MPMGGFGAPACMFESHEEVTWRLPSAVISSHTRSGKEPAPPPIRESLPPGSGQKPALTSANASLLRIRAKL